MAKRKSRRVGVVLTQRALHDILEIEAYSIEQFGRRATNRYLASIEASLQRLMDFPGLLTEEPQLHPWLKFYRSGKHLLACEVQTDCITVLTLIAATADIPTRLADLEPTLVVEVELLHEQLRRAGGRKSKKD